MSNIKRYLSYFVLAMASVTPSLAQFNCNFTANLSSASASSAFDNRFRLCQSYSVAVTLTGSPTAIQFQFEGASDMSGSPGAYTPFAALNGRNPDNRTGAGTRVMIYNLFVTQNGSHADWLRFNIVSLSGSVNGVFAATAASNPPSKGPLNPRPVTSLTYAPYPVFNASNGDQLMTLTGNITKFFIVGLSVNLYFNMTFCQDGVGSHTISGAPSFMSGFSFTVTGANLCAFQSFYSPDGVNIVSTTSSGGGSGGTIDINGQSCTTGSSCNVNAGATPGSIALNAAANNPLGTGVADVNYYAPPGQSVVTPSVGVATYGSIAGVNVILVGINTSPPVITANITSSVCPTSGVIDKPMIVVMRQDGTGGRTNVWPTCFNSPPTIASEPNAVTFVQIALNSQGTYDVNWSINTSGHSIQVLGSAPANPPASGQLYCWPDTTRTTMACENSSGVISAMNASTLVTATFTESQSCITSSATPVPFTSTVTTPANAILKLGDALTVYMDFEFTGSGTIPDMGIDLIINGGNAWTMLQAPDAVISNATYQTAVWHIFPTVVASGANSTIVTTYIAPQNGGGGNGTTRLINGTAPLSSFNLGTTFTIGTQLECSIATGVGTAELFDIKVVKQ